MKHALALFLSVMLIAVSSNSFAQSRGGNIRDPRPHDDGNSGGGSRPTRLPPPAPVVVQPPAPSPVETYPPAPPPPHEQYPVRPTPMPIDPPHCVVVVDHPTPILIIEHIEVAEPEIQEAVLWDAESVPARSCFDFSAQEVVASNSKSFDIKFVVSGDVPQIIVGRDADIQNLGSMVHFEDVKMAPSTGWSATHGVEVEPENVYLVWTWDNQYYKFVVTTLSENRVAFEWEKLPHGMRIATSEDYRNGIEHRVVADRFGR
ncbi:MAG: hypothetical protein HY961_11250 [Ignavibacteriae bacterium]|nr:hypothetical protein [Ignavibacteriota bacterium]